jgi:surface antigen
MSPNSINNKGAKMKNRCKVVLLTGTLILVGCSDINNEQMGTVAGGLVGGLVGNQFGGGSGKVLATAGGALVGAYLGGNVGKYMDRQDRIQMQQALETAQTGRVVQWTNPDSGNQYRVQPKKTYDVNDAPCREYTTTAIIGGQTQNIVGKACRQGDGSWRVVSEN